MALCPRRFLDNHSVFFDFAQYHFKTTDNILVFSEVQLKGIGSFDFVMLKHKPLSIDIEDFIVVEFQTGQTTGTGKLVGGLTDFMAGRNITYESYKFGLNTYDVWKRTFTQILNSWRRTLSAGASRRAVRGKLSTLQRGPAATQCRGQGELVLMRPLAGWPARRTHPHN